MLVRTLLRPIALRGVSSIHAMRLSSSYVSRHTQDMYAHRGLLAMLTQGERAATLHSDSPSLLTLYSWSAWHVHHFSMLHAVKYTHGQGLKFSLLMTEFPVDPQTGLHDRRTSFHASVVPCFYL